MKEVLEKVENLVSDTYKITRALQCLNVAMNALDQAVIAISKVEYEHCEDLSYCKKIKDCEKEIAFIQAKLISDQDLTLELLEDVKNSVME